MIFSGKNVKYRMLSSDERKSEQRICALFCFINRAFREIKSFHLYQEVNRNMNCEDMTTATESHRGPTNKMAVMPVKKLLLQMGCPIMISMMLQAVYNIVDSIFVSNMAGNGEAALNALTLAFPVQMLMVAVSIGTGVGTNALLSKSLGQGNREKVNRIAGNALFLGAVIYLVFLVFGILGVNIYVTSQSSNPEIISMAVSYLRICCCASMGIIFFSIGEKLLQATGKSTYSTIAQISGAVTNIILDPILIYGWLGLPAMGVKGAAWATVIGQLVSMCVAFGFHFRVNREIETGREYLKPDTQVIGEICAIGLPAIIAQALMSIMTYSLNVILVQIGETAVTAYGLYYKVQQFVLFAAFGLRDAITPVISFNHGMRSRKRVEEGIRYGMIYTLAIMAVGMVLIEILAVPLTSLFGLSGETEMLCVGAMRIVSLSFLFAGANVAFQGIFQALDSGMPSLVISVMRQLLFILPVARFFTGLVTGQGTNPNLVWLTFLIGEGASFVFACIFMKYISEKKVKTLDKKIARL